MEAFREFSSGPSEAVFFRCVAVLGPRVLRVHSFFETQNLVYYVLGPNRSIEHGVI